MNPGDRRQQDQTEDHHIGSPMSPSRVSFGSGQPSLDAWTEPDPVTDSEVARCLTSMSSSVTTAPRPTPGIKPTRLSLACNPCRKRKVRCDARQPKCQNCTLRGELCETSDLRRPGAPVAARKRAPATRRHSVSASVALERLERPREEETEQGQTETRLQEQQLQSRQQERQLPPAQPQSFNDSFDHSPPSASSPREQPNGHRRPSRTSVRRPSSRADRDSIRAQWSPRTSPATTRSVGDTELGRPPSSKSQRPGPDHISWLSRAYQESSAAQLEAQNSSEPAVEDAAAPEAGVVQTGPVVATPDMVVNTDGSPNRLKVLGGSSLQCLFNFADLWLAGYGFDLTAPLFRHGMSHSEEFQMPLFPSIPNLPDRQALTLYIDAFFDRIWPLFPIVDRASVDADMDFFLELQSQDSRGLAEKLNATRVPSISMLYGIACIGLNELGSDRGDHGHEDSLDTTMVYLTACYSLHGHLTAVPYHSSVQALLVLALALRGCCKDGQAWHVVGHAVRIALSLGLHKSADNQVTLGGKVPVSSSLTRTPAIASKQQKQQSHADGLRERIWWSCFTLERLMQLECGRPSSIDHDYDQLAMNCSVVPYNNDEAISEDEEEGEPQDNDAFTWFTAWVSLAAIMGQISDRLYSHRFAGSGEMLVETARQARCLTEWEAALPEQLRPQNTFFTESTDNSHILAVFLSQQYYHAQIAVLRSAIIFPQKSFTAEVKKRSADAPEITRLLGGASMCIQAARNLVLQTLQLSDAGVRSTLLGVPQTFLAGVVLALSILRAPTSTLARSDVELLTTTTEYVEGCFKYRGYQDAFVAILPRLRERVTAVFKKDVKPRGLQLPQGRGRGEEGSAGPVGRQGQDTGVAVAERGTGLATTAQRFPGLPVPPFVEQGCGDGQYSAQQRLDLGVTGEPSVGAFVDMEFEQLWNMMDADLIMYDMVDQFNLV